MYLKPASVGRDKLDSRWGVDHFLGIKDESAELIIGTTVGVLKVKSVRSFTDFGDWWKALSLKAVVGLPWCPIPGRDGTEIKSHVKMMSEFGDGLQHSDESAPRIHKVRAVKFLKEDIAKYGATSGCQGCIAANRNAPAVNHSDACRVRIERLMGEDRHPRYLRAMDGLADEAV